MESCYKKLRLYPYCTLICFLGLGFSALAGGLDESIFVSQYEPTIRESCEMYFSHPSVENLTDRPECDSIEVFKPLLKRQVSEDGKIVATVSSEFHPSWDLRDVKFEMKMNLPDRPDLNFLEGSLVGIINNVEPIKEVAIGRLGDNIILEIRAVNHTQIIFTPYYCEGVPEPIYKESQSLKWLPSFAGEIFEKTFYSKYYCN